MPFGLCNAPATFERMIDSALRGKKRRACLCYLDDIIVFSSGFEQHLQLLSEVLSTIAKSGFQLNTEKNVTLLLKVKCLDTRRLRTAFVQIRIK